MKAKPAGAQLQVILWLGPDEEAEHWLDDLEMKDNVREKIGNYVELVGPVAVPCSIVIMATVSSAMLII